MFKHLLVPLDGSGMAEAALPAAGWLAERLGARVTLIHVMEKDPPERVHGQGHLRTVEEARSYLGRVQTTAFAPGTAVVCHVHTAAVGDVAASLAAQALELGPDLIVMVTHGRRGPKEWLFGSVAQQVIGQGRTPVVIVPPAPRFAGGGVFHLHKILAPLDAQEGHPAGRAVAVGLARAVGAALHLVTVVPTLGTLTWEWAAAGRLLRLATARLLEIGLAGARDYLVGEQSRLAAEGLTVTSEIVRGDPAKTIAATAERCGAELIVLGTHGKAGLQAFWAGSVAARVSSRTGVPLLLAPAAED